MGLITAKYFHDCTETPLQFNTESGWKSVCTGLRLVVVGYVILIGGALAGWLLLRIGLDDGPIVRLTSRSTQDDRDTFILLGVLALTGAGLFSYGFVLAGQWQCLMYAPQRQHTKELMYVCFNLVLVGSLLNAIGVYLDGARTYAAIREGLDEVAKLDPLSPGTLLQLGSIALGLVGSLVFSQFLRSVASCFQDRARVRSVDLNLGFVGLLVGGSAGTLLCVARLSFRAEFVPWLVSGWLLCFLWHLYLVYSVCRCLEDGLTSGAEVNGKWTRQDQGATALHSLSGLHRLVKQTEE
jgi:hypothetical protein